MTAAHLPKPEPAKAGAYCLRFGRDRVFVGTCDHARAYLHGLRRVRFVKVLLIQGERGTGKSALAYALHLASGRKGAFIALTAAQINGPLANANLFGVADGCATNAKERDGFLRAARGGTIFIDDFDALEVETQARLLRFLETGEVIREGKEQPEGIDVLMVFATNANMDSSVQSGRFRADFVSRLGLPLVIPPLRQRLEELPALTESLLERVSPEVRVPLSTTAEAAIQKHDWPGNVRELQHRLEHACTIALDYRDMYGDALRLVPDDLGLSEVDEETSLLLNDPSRRKPGPSGYLDGREEEVFASLERNDWNVQATARELRVGRASVRTLIRRSRPRA